MAVNSSIPGGAQGFVTTTGTEQLQNKEYLGGTASTTNRFVLSQDTKANLDALARKEGAIYYATDLDQAFIDDGSTLIAVGSGTGELNYVQNPDAEINVTSGVSTVGSGTVGTHTANPLEGTTSFVVNGSTGGSQGGSWALDTIDDLYVGRLMKFSIGFKPISGSEYVQGDWQVAIHDGSGFVAGTTHEPVAAKGIWEALFVPEDGVTYTVYVTAEGGSPSGDIIVDQIKVTPEEVVVGFAADEGTSFSTVSNLTTNIQTEGGFYYQRGNRMVAEAALEFSGANTEGIVELALPSGFSVDTSKIISSLTGGGVSNSQAVGSWWMEDADTDANNTAGTVIYSVANDVLYLVYSAKGASDVIVRTDQGEPFTVADGDVITWKFEVPISEWAGTTQTFANNRVEYLSNTDTATGADDTSSFAYGPSGQSIVSISSANAIISKRVRAQQSSQPTDDWSLKVSPGNDIWVDAAQAFPWQDTGTAIYGMRLTNVSATDADVEFGGDGATEQDAWSAYTGWSWRVVKSSNPLGIGTGVATADQPGAVLKGRVATHVLSSDVTSGTLSDLTFNNLNAGEWYQVFLQARLTVSDPSTDDEVGVNITHDGNTLGGCFLRIASGSANNEIIYGTNVIFEASVSTLTFETVAADANSYVSGNGTRNETFAQLVERPDIASSTTDYD